MGEPGDDDRAAYQKIEELLSNEGPLTERVIRERLGYSESHIRAGLRWLVGEDRATLVAGSDPQEWIA